MKIVSARRAIHERCVPGVGQDRVANERIFKDHVGITGKAGPSGKGEAKERKQIPHNTHSQEDGLGPEARQAAADGLALRSEEHLGPARRVGIRQLKVNP